MKLKDFTWLLAGILMVGCSSDDDNVVESENTVSGTEETSVLGLTEEQQSMVAPLNDFSVRLFQQLNASAEDKSTVVSPLGTSFVLGMLNEGATGQTGSEIVAALGLTGNDKESVSLLFTQYISAIPAADGDVTVAFANNVSVNNRFNLKDTYQTAVEHSYDASVFSLDFASPAATSAVNSWCSQHTRGLIPSIVEKLSPDDVLCLLNAIYFKARWTTPFNKQSSHGMPFYSAQGERILKMMSRTATMQYAEQKDLQALRLPLAKGVYAMTIVLPSAKLGLDAFVRSLTAQQLNSLAFSDEQVEAAIPIFTTTVDTDLARQLKALGVNRLFNTEAELTGMVSSPSPLYVSKMKQNTRIGIDEDGCEGAAVSIAELTLGADFDNTSKPKQFMATSPFVYYISEVQSGTILFMGQFCGD